MPNLKELLQCQILRPTPKSQHRIHKPKILYCIWFPDIGLHIHVRLGRTTVCWLWRPRKHVYSSWNVKNALLDTKLLPFSVYGYCRILWHIWFLTLIMYVPYIGCSRKYRRIRWNYTNILFLTECLTISGLRRHLGFLYNICNNIFSIPWLKL